MTIRYKLLKNFPENLIREAKNTFYENFPDIKSLENLKLSNHENSLLRYTLIDVNLSNDLFTNKMLCMISKPNCGRGRVHIDQGRNFCINIPIRVDPKLGPFVVIKANYYGTKVELNKKEYDYIPEYYENINVISPILINTNIPHAFVNNSNDWRIMISVFPKAATIEDAWNLVKKWE